MIKASYRKKADYSRYSYFEPIGLELIYNLIMMPKTIELTINMIKEFHAIIEYYNSLQEKKSKLFKEVGMNITIMKTKGNDDELNVTQIFNYQLRGLF